MEEDLVSMAKSGDKNAFEYLVNMYHKKLYVIAQNRIDKEEDVNDAIQNTLLQAFANIDTIKSVTSFNGWITQILLNNCKDILKIRQRNIYSYDNMQNEVILLEDNDEFIAIETLIDAFSIIDLFTETEKNILMMYFLDGYTTKEISQILDINEGTIRAKISRLRKRIKEKCDNESYGIL